MSYYDMTPSDVEREGATLGEDIEVEEETIYSEQFELGDDVYEQVTVGINGTYNTYSEAFLFDCFTYEWSQWTKREEERIRARYCSCESLPEALSFVESEPIDEYGTAKKLAVIWSKVATRMKTWKPFT